MSHANRTIIKRFYEREFNNKQILYLKIDTFIFKGWQKWKYEERAFYYFS